MSNEFLFFFHVLLGMGFLLGALRLGRGALQAVIILEVVLANLFVIKQMRLFGFSVTCSDVYAIGAMLGLNLMQEYWGKEAARQCIKMGFWGLLFVTAMAYMHLLYRPFGGEEIQSAFSLIFASTPRIFLSSISVYFFVQRLDMALFGWMKQRWEGGLGWRVGVSLFMTQVIDTSLFTFLGLYGIVASLSDVILVSLIVKGMVIAMSSLVVGLSRRWVRDVSV